MEEDKLKERQELERLLSEPDENQDASAEDENKATDTPEDDDKSGSTPPAQAEQDNEDSEEDNNSDNEDADQEDDNKDTKERWSGKSREEVIKEYESLEERIAALEGKGKPKEDTPEDKDKPEDKEVDIPSPEELQKMTPTDFAKWVMLRIDEGVKKTIESQTQIRDSVRKEISDAKKEHPLDDPDYRKMVLAIIDAAGTKGTVIPLKEACKQVDAFLGKHQGQSNDAGDISDEERSRLKKAKAQVESGAGAPAQPDGSDAETKRIQKALGRTGSRGSLGGLGL
jgi:hypothetical protein